jgi:hypothetical protein
MQSDDPVKIDDVHRQLSAKAREMEAAAVYIEDDPTAQDNEKLREAKKSLRKLEKKKRELKWSTNIGASP